MKHIVLLFLLAIGTQASAREIIAPAEIERRFTDGSLISEQEIHGTYLGYCFEQDLNTAMPALLVATPYGGGNINQTLPNSEKTLIQFSYNYKNGITNEVLQNIQFPPQLNSPAKSDGTKLTWTTEYSSNDFTANYVASYAARKYENHIAVVTEAASTEKKAICYFDRKRK